MNKDFKQFAQKLGVQFLEISLLQTACTHRSYLNEVKNSKIEHNERLEFLGDAVLELVVTDFLYKKYPKKHEGDLTAYRSALVNTNSLSRVADHIGINEYLILSKGEAKDTGRARAIILADAVEAIIGAIYLDQGYATVEAFIARSILEFIKIDDIVSNKLWLDAKSRFQERAQEVVGQTPIYKTVKETGPDHDKQFTVGVFIGDTQIALGQGPSKNEAEQKAAEKAIEVKGW
ncbi:MAG: ribonuclease III [Candidatus Pacebacteria bacterium]|nr:ribonuclease III [Candidatus Paceibacterota bacterium]